MSRLAHLTSASVLLLVGAAAAGCLESVTRFVPLDGELESQARLDFGNYGGVQADAIARDPTTGLLHVFISGQGLLIIDDEGNAQGAIPQQTTEMFNFGLGDLTIFDGHYAITSGREVRLFDMQTEELTDTLQIDTPFNNGNGWTDAFAVCAHDDNKLTVAATHWDWYAAVPQRSELQQLDADSGEVEQSAPVQIKNEDGDVSIQGLAKHPTEDVYVVVAANLLGAVAPDGTLLAGGEMPEVGFGNGLTIDPDKGLVWVTDGSDLEAHAYDLSLFAP
jgi:hypothetical protein